VLAWALGAGRVGEFGSNGKLGRTLGELGQGSARARGGRQLGDFRANAECVQAKGRLRKGVNPSELGFPGDRFHIQGNEKQGAGMDETRPATVGVCVRMEMSMPTACPQGQKQANALETGGGN